MWQSRTETVEESIMHKFAATDLPFRSLMLHAGTLCTTSTSTCMGYALQCLGAQLVDIILMILAKMYAYMM